MADLVGQYDPFGTDDNDTSLDLDDIEDLSEISGNALRKLTDVQARNVERQGKLYIDFYRQLQIRQEYQPRFYGGVLRVVRNKHLDHLKRGTPASIRSLTDLVLRGFGYIVWKTDSEYLIPAEMLDEGEARLCYFKKQGLGHADHARFYSILEPLWKRMRNLIFEVKLAPKTRGRPGRDTSPSSTIDTQPDTPHPIPGSRPNPLSVRMNRQTRLSPTEASDAILALIDQLAGIRANTEPYVFETLWECHIGRLEELDLATSEMPTQASDTTDDNTEQAAPPRSLSNEPFNTAGMPLQPHLPVSALVPPTSPSHMSIWLSTCGIVPASSISTLSTATLSTMSKTRHIPAQSSSPYLWPNAPVSNFDLGPFFEGINARIEPPTASVIGWVLSYGWTDRCHFISSGLLELGKIQDTEAAMTPESISEVDHLPFPRQEVGRTVIARPRSPPLATAARGKTTDFELEQWATIKLGWRDFQHDLTDAARLGVQLWRMKVCVLTLTK